MSILLCSNRGQVDKYASAKSMGQFSLAASLIVDDIKDLYDMVMKGPDAVSYFWALAIVVGISLVLQFIATIFSVILFFKVYPKHGGHPPPGYEVEMTPPADSNGDSAEPSGTSTDTIAVGYHGNDDLGDGIPPLVMKRLNDGLTIIAIFVGILHLIKNGLHNGII